MKFFSRIVTFLLIPCLAQSAVEGLGFGQLSAQGSELRNISEFCFLSSELAGQEGVRGDKPVFQEQALSLEAWDALHPLLDSVLNWWALYKHNRLPDGAFIWVSNHR